MKGKVLRSAALLILAAAILLPFAAACGKDVPQDTTEPDATTPDPEQTEPAPELSRDFVNGTAPAYTIVRPEVGLLYSGMAVEISSALCEISGVYFGIESDYVGWKGIPDRNEILVGDTNRDETAEVKARLNENNPYEIATVGKRIVIVGIDERNTARAVEKFISDYTGKTVYIDYIVPESSDTAVPVSAPLPEKSAQSIDNTDRTGHPEVSADGADVEALLASDPAFDYTEEYKIRFSGTPGNKVWTADEIKTGLIVSRYDTLYNVVADVNVRAYGAVGDGKADDTAAFKAAVAAVEELGGGTVYAPPGYYCLTETIKLPPLVTLAGELRPGTAEGTVLCIYGGKGKTDRNKAAVICGSHSSVQNLAFWYPEQTFVNGKPIPYPASITQGYINGLTVRNVTFVNSYRGIDAAQQGAVYALQYIRDNCGTCLEYGFRNEYDLDVGKIENLSLSPDYWLASGLPGTPNAELLRTYMLRNSEGIMMGGADWFYFSDLKFSGLNKGMHFFTDTCSGSQSLANGQILNPVITDCFNAIYVDNVSWFEITGGKLSGSGNKGAAAVFFGPEAGTLRDNQPGSLLFIGTELSSAGQSAVISQSVKPSLVFTDCVISSAYGRAIARQNSLKVALINSEVKDAGVYEEKIVVNPEAEKAPVIDTADYVKTTKPRSDAFIDLTCEPYNAKRGEDISEKLQKAIDDLGAGGGTVYLPAGEYYVNSHIDLKPGVELRGSTFTAHVDIYLTLAKTVEDRSEDGTNPYRACGTVIYTDFGMGDSDGLEFISMYEGSGLCGLSIEYYRQKSTGIIPCSYTVRGHGSNVYVIDVGMSSSWNGIDFASEKCDNHYVEFVWGVGLANGVRVGAGSEGGIIRDCHYTVNCWQIGRYRDSNYWDNVAAVAREKSTTFLITDSTGEVLYNNFSINQRNGISIGSGARGVLLAGTAVDWSDCDIRMREIRCHDGYGITAALRDHLIVIIIHKGNAFFAGHLFCFFAVRIANGDDIRKGMRLIDPGMVRPPGT
ncbi:MAG: hypothetical protein J6V01_05865, partial [Clostridia bacterium]|nr:hypothetical protein [Clostridia bacterium]